MSVVTWERLPAKERRGLLSYLCDEIAEQLERGDGCADKSERDDARLWIRVNRAAILRLQQIKRTPRVDGRAKPCLRHALPWRGLLPTERRHLLDWAESEIEECRLELAAESRGPSAQFNRGWIRVLCAATRALRRQK